MWHFQGYIGEINIYPDYSHKQMSAPWTLSVHLPFKYKRNHLFSPGSNSHVFKISKDIKFLNASNGCTRALARSLGKGIIPFCITYTFGLYFFCFASSRSIFCSHTALKKMGVNFFFYAFDWHHGLGQTISLWYTGRELCASFSFTSLVGSLYMLSVCYIYFGMKSP